MHTASRKRSLAGGLLTLAQALRADLPLVSEREKSLWVITNRPRGPGGRTMRSKVIQVANHFPRVFGLARGVRVCGSIECFVVHN